MKCTPARYTLKNVLGVRQVRFRFRWPGRVVLLGRLDRVSLDRRSLDRLSLDRISWSRVALVASAVAAATACGRRATLDDCRLIVDRSVELQMRGVYETDPKAIAKREAVVRAELDGQIIACERNRRVTDSMMACVKSASTTAELEKCLK